MGVSYPSHDLILSMHGVMNLDNDTVSDSLVS